MSGTIAFSLLKSPETGYPDLEDTRHGAYPLVLFCFLRARMCKDVSLLFLHENYEPVQKR